MEAIILSKDQYTELVARLDELVKRINAKNEPKKDTNYLGVSLCIFANAQQPTQKMQAGRAIRYIFCGAKAPQKDAASIPHAIANDIKLCKFSQYLSHYYL
ncbi:MAG TPA: hypothetical protein VKY32_01915 [Flavobacterium sp.]|nr:hypothetical protein [Flavobacterium sp.]